ncbi:hypothetical protein PsAD2_03345 [Pseudovibrio axinellae]|uniref:Uncharacterized protein n=1 Tax=Pseudovibrio axinellae TaxID=989403 RepID=A0A161VBH9_9HYPH|nr:hypothetical protein [Pseudovibrio axinellae]KZL16728.1 hypothetical protein PsAD2_03345 [Pseudovibrio axinellae]SEQ77087.1 hypothetical protein SAMN05421798_104165 [Pseudovibrio axinellae]
MPMLGNLLAFLSALSKALSGLFSYLERRDLKKLGAYEQQERANVEGDITLSSIDEAASEVGSMTPQEKLEEALK